MAFVSFANLDLSFMKKAPLKKAPAPKRKKKERDLRSPLGAPMVMSDLKEFVSNATDKPVRITSRSQLAAYERSNGIKQVGNDLKGKIVSGQKRRDADRAAYLQKNARRTRVEAKWV